MQYPELGFDTVFTLIKKKPPSYQQRAASYLILDILWKQNPVHALLNLPVSLHQFFKQWGTRARWNLPSFPQSLGSNLKQHVATEQKHRCCSLETNTKRQKTNAKKKKMRDRNEDRPSILLS